MFLMQMCHQCMVGISAGLSKASQLLQGHPRIASEPSSKALLGMSIEADGLFVRSKQYVTRFALHDISPLDGSGAQRVRPALFERLVYCDGFFLVPAGRYAS
jgi:hypothetical protein